MIKAVIFDMGGVLLRSEDYSTRDQLAQQYHMTRIELEDVVFGSESAQLASIGKLTIHQHWENISRTLNIPPADLPEFQRMFWAGDRVDYGLVGYLQSLRPKIKTGLLSNAWDDARGMLNSWFRLDTVFDYSIFSAEAGLAKPHEPFYRHILEKLDVEAGESIFVDDVQENIDTANKIGIHGVRFLNSNQARADIDALIHANGNGNH